MITDNIGGALPSAANAVSGRKGSEEAQGGFSDALSGFEKETDQGAAKGSDSEKVETDVQAEDAVLAKPAVRPKPIIDIRPESLRRHAEAEDDVVADTADIKPLNFAEKKLRDALQVAKALARKADAEEAGSLKAATVIDDTAEPDQTMLAADDAKIVDVLSLLNVNDSKAAELQAMMQRHVSANSTGKRGKEGDERVREVSAGPASDATERRFNLTASHAADTEMPTDTAAEVPGAKQFRFTNARNENQSIDMSISNGRERATAEFRQSSTGGAETVTVIDSRRFLGLAPNSNGASLTALLSGDSEWSAAMQPSASLSNAATQSSTGNVVNTLKLQMNPFELGSVTATLRLHGEHLNVHLTVETRAAYRQLSEDSASILDALKSQGFSVDQVTLSIAPTADTDTANNQAGGQQTGQQQAAAEGGRQGNAAGRGQGHTNGQQGNENDAASDNATVPAADGSRPDQLYL